MAMDIQEFWKDNLLISTDASRLQIEMICDFLSRTHWAQNQSRQATERAIANSLSFGVYDGDKQISFARVVTDFATFAWIADVFILEEYRGRGLAKWLMSTILAHPELQSMRGWVLATLDAHGLYQQFGFVGLHNPERFMELFRSDL